MSADQLLFAEQATTSLYERVGDATDRRVLALGQSRATYSPLVGATRVPPDLVDADLASPPEIVVQLRKRNRKTELLINGYVSTGKTTTTSAGINVTDHYLESHTGLHEDVQTHTRVFSPIAVVAAVEDGQHALQTVSVAVIYNYAHNGRALEPSTVLTEARVLDHRVSDVRCNVVRVPYPLPYPNPPTLTLVDNLQRRKFEAVKRGKMMVSKNYISLASFGSVLLAMRSYATGASGAMQLAVATAFAGGSALTGDAALAFHAHGWKFPAYLLLAALPTLPAVVSLFAQSQWLALLVPVVTTVGNAVTKWIDSPEPPALRMTKFTLHELAVVVEGLNALRAPEGDEMPLAISDPSVQKSTQYKQEMLLWYWLAGENATDDEDIAPLDTSRLVATAEYVAQLHLRITVDDALSCDATSHVHNLHCGRDDGPVLAAAAGGTLDDLVRLYTAIRTLESMLVNATAVGAENKMDTWMDRDRYNPTRWMIAFYEVLKQERDALLAGAQSVASSVRNLRGQGIRRRAKNVVVEKWVETSDPNTEERMGVLKTVLANLRTKLIEPLFASGSAGAKLFMDVTAALNDRRDVLATTPPVAWVRPLPQRALSNYGGYLFSAVRDTGSTHVDVDVGSTVARLYDEYHDASKWLSACMKGSRMALKRLVPEWEASSDTRIRLDCMCSTIDSNFAPFVEAVTHATLSLTTPVDIRFAGVLATPTEHSQRRIRIVVERARTRETASVLEALKLEHSDDYLLACQVFGDLWANELVALYQTAAHKQVEMLEMASVRAAARLRGAGELLLDLVREKNLTADTDTFDDVSLDGGDIALVATLAGRDAGQMMRRLLFSQNYVAVRSVMVPTIRQAARAAVRTASVFSKTVPTTLPHEACASLFGDRLDGLVAFLRAMDVSDDRMTLEAVAASYPSVRLLGLDATTQDESVRLARDRASPEPPRPVALTSQELVRAMRFRMASLRMDSVPVDDVAASPQSVTTDQLATQLAATSIKAHDHFSFYVPFGFGDARPPPTLPSCSAPLFGTVPVYGPALVEAFRSIGLAASANPASGDSNAVATLSVRLEPTFDCLEPPSAERGGEETESVHPNVVQVLRDGSVVVVRYTASRVPTQTAPPSAANGQPAAYSAADVARAASVHVCSKDASQLALAVSSMAWNAERVVQAVVAALASGDDDEEYGGVEVTFALPPSDARSSPWYASPPNPMAIAQRELRLDRNTQLWAAVLKSTIEQQKTLVAAALTKLRTLDGSGGGTVLGADPARKLLVADLETPELDPNPIVDFDKRAAAFVDLFSFELLEAIESKLSAQTRADQMASLLTAIMEVEDLPSPSLYNPPDDGNVSGTLLPARDAADQAHALLASLGVGMAMLTPQLAPLPVRCVALIHAGLPWNAASRMEALASAFAKCSAVRLSEACLLVSRRF